MLDTQKFRCGQLMVSFAETGKGGSIFEYRFRWQHVQDFLGILYSKGPVCLGQFRVKHHGLYHLQHSPVESFRYSIFLWRVCIRHLTMYTPIFSHLWKSFAIYSPPPPGLRKFTRSPVSTSDRIIQFINTFEVSSLVLMIQILSEFRKNHHRYWGKRYRPDEVQVLYSNFRRCSLISTS